MRARDLGYTSIVHQRMKKEESSELGRRDIMSIDLRDEQVSAELDSVLLRMVTHRNDLALAVQDEVEYVLAPLGKVASVDPARR
jgi:hypothetical protein